MSEQFTLFRGQSGTPYLLALRCAHRGTQLSSGWVEGDQIRCFYHGWTYDGTGQCVQQPAEVTLPPALAGDPSAWLPSPASWSRLGNYEFLTRNRLHSKFIATTDNRWMGAKRSGYNNP